MTTQNWIARYIPTATKDCPICIRIGDTNHFISLEEAYRIKCTVTMAIDDFKEASQNRQNAVTELEEP